MSQLLEFFSAGQTAKLSEVDYQTLNYWANSGFLTPSLSAAAGRGTRRLYSFNDLVALRVARKLRDAGISLQALRQVLHYLQKRRERRSFADAYLLTDGKDVYERHGREGLTSLLRKPGQAVFTWIDLGSVVDELRERMAA